MQIIRPAQRCSFVLLLFALASGCSPGQAKGSSAASAMSLERIGAQSLSPPRRAPQHGVREKPVATATRAAAQPTAAVARDLTGPASTAAVTPETRLPPERWRSWPVTPTLGPRMNAVYLEGLRLGRDPHAFSKAGDCQNVPAAFLGLYDMPGRYYLGEGYEYLQETIDRFSGSFGRQGAAVRGGFNLPALFAPIQADLKMCKPDEAPLECELRLHNPSFVIISMEIAYPKRTADNYVSYLRQAVAYAIDQAVVPILATKADNVEGDHSINLATAQVAYETEVPLWNFWRAAQRLPDKGIDWERDPTGFHITVQGWEVRSFTALQTLDALWREAQGLSEPS